MHFLADYGLFLAKMVTFTIMVIILFAAIFSMASKNKDQQKGHLSIKKLNQKFDDMKKALQAEILSKKILKQLDKTHKKEAKIQSKLAETKRRIYVLSFNGDIKASAVDHLREEITAILSIATSQDEVVVRLESSGGLVHAYGFAASQLQRIRDKQIPLTIIVDKVAASGGYLMACVANKILAAPFAIIGSIGVIAQLPNLHRWLQKNQIDFEQITAGEYKRTLTIFGENTIQGKEKFKQELEEIHDHFKGFIQENRPHVDIQKVATGEHWLAKKALELKLVDDLITSDDYLFSASYTADIYQIEYKAKQKLTDRLSHFIHQGATEFNFLFK